MLPIHKIVWHEFRATAEPVRVPEPSEAMEDLEQIHAYLEAYEWGGPTSALQFFHIARLSELIKPGDVVVDLACGPGPLLTELAKIYPTCRFIGVDLSAAMLEALQTRAADLKLTNVEVRCEDIRTLPSFGSSQADVIISTSALHHLPSEADLKTTFARADLLLKEGGSLYFFDFCLLKSPATRALMVSDVAKSAPPITAIDYKHSLDAAFPLAAVRSAASHFGRRQVRLTASPFADFFYFLSSSASRQRSPEAEQLLKTVKSTLRAQHILDLFMLRHLQRKVMLPR
jgi:arsenite methyltransferase